MWMILKKTKSWQKRKQKRKPNILQKKYLNIANTNMIVKLKYNYNYAIDLYFFS